MFHCRRCRGGQLRQRWRLTSRLGPSLRLGPKSSPRYCEKSSVLIPQRVLACYGMAAGMHRCSVSGVISPVQRLCHLLPCCTLVRGGCIAVHPHLGTHVYTHRPLLLSYRDLQPPSRVAANWAQQRDTLLRRVSGLVAGTLRGSRGGSSSMPDGAAAAADAGAMAAADRAMQELLVRRSECAVS
jgi:hypothetical protein